MDQLIKGSNSYNFLKYMLDIANDLKKEGYIITSDMTINDVREIYFSQERAEQFKNNL
ncbi:hypothetical protein JOC34_000499 [Virgibacillus halotolerans]|uniref:hypothetical protein n=1 Tax=Virgibacillus halotolerans TaxID=1071053 RepID=UPI001960CB65|nr:hypothetical protein [Virgibacillus halotolerans]MBM7598142.1 hypothetical protein [Virgibacillus halotolerans]